MARRKNLVVAGLAIAIAFGLEGRASAQTTGSGDQPSATPSTDSASNTGADAYNTLSYDRGGNVSVLQRERPDYKALGIHAGDFLVYPKLHTTFAYDDNIFAVQNGAVGDGIFTVAPEVSFQSNWSRNGLSGRVWMQQDLYTHYSEENASQYGGDVSGKLQFGRSTLTTGVSSGDYALARTASINIGQGFSTHRTTYNYTDADVQWVQELSRIRLSVRYDYEVYDFANGTTPGGQLVFNEGLNHVGQIYTGKAEFAISPDTAVYVTAIGNHQQYSTDFPQATFSRNSTGYEFDVGANFDITRLIRGEVQVGYLNQDYTASQFAPINGPSVNVKLEWFPTQLTTVTLNVSRAVADAVVPGSSGSLTSVEKLEVDHELLRNLILSASGEFGQDQYNGIDRNDTHQRIGFSANWLINRWLGLTFAYTYTDQNSSGAERGPSFNDNRGSIATVVQF